jgi:hypothetical protein
MIANLVHYAALCNRVHLRDRAAFAEGDEKGTFLLIRSKRFAIWSRRAKRKVARLNEELRRLSSGDLKELDLLFVESCHRTRALARRAPLGARLIDILEIPTGL